jgi:hypothetical protein
MNEVELTAATFTSARGFQIQCKNAVNDSINYINSREFGWPFNHQLYLSRLAAGQARFTVPANTKHVDYETFRLVRDPVLGVPSRSLRVMDYKDYADYYIYQEDDAALHGATKGGIPSHVFRTPDDQFGLFPYPNLDLEIKFDYYIKNVQLSVATDVPTIPESFRQVIVDGATAYAYQYRGEAQQYGINFARFEEGIKHMQSILLNRTDYVRSTYRPRSQRYGTNVAGF